MRIGPDETACGTSRERGVPPKIRKAGLWATVDTLYSRHYIDAAIKAVLLLAFLPWLSWPYIKPQG